MINLCMSLFNPFSIRRILGIKLILLKPFNNANNLEIGPTIRGRRNSER